MVRAAPASSAARAPAAPAVALLLLALVAQGSARPVLHPGIWAKPDYSVYHNREAVWQEAQAIVDAHPDIMKMEVRRAEDKGYAVEMQVVTVEVGGLSGDHSRKLRVLVDFGEHARELVSSETGLRLMRLLGDLDEAARVTGEYAPRVLELLPHTVFTILPMENARGRALVEGGDLCERKNGRGVDPNRNYVVHWGVKEADYDPKEEYPGEHPLSEPEAQIVQGIVHAWKPHAWVNVHSGMEALFMPFDHQAVIPTGAASQAQLGMLKHLNKLVCGNRCAVGSGGKSVGYLAHGTATDHMYLKEDVPLSFTWEIYGDMKAHYLDCFRMFNPLTREALDRVVSAWAPGPLYLVALLPTHPVTRHFMEQSGIPLSPLAEGDSHRLLGEAPQQVPAEGTASLVQYPQKQPAPAQAASTSASAGWQAPPHSATASRPVGALRDRSASFLASHTGSSAALSAASGRQVEPGFLPKPTRSGGGGLVSSRWFVGLATAAAVAALLVLRCSRLSWHAQRALRSLRPDTAKADEPEGRER